MVLCLIGVGVLCFGFVVFVWGCVMLFVGCFCEVVGFK